MLDLHHSRSRSAAVGVVLLAMGVSLWPNRVFSDEVTSSNLGAKFGDTRDFVHVLDVKRSTTNDDELVVTLRIDPGFHINANPASLAFLLPTRLMFGDVEPTRVVYPSPIQFKPKFVDDIIDVYEGTIGIEALFPSGTLSQTSIPQGTVAAQACTDEVCLPPAELPLPRE